jgi:L-threonylcarbamoyladenylate synthase
MKYKHYSPKTEVFLVEGDSYAFAEFVNGKKNCLAICFTEDEEKLKVKALCYGATEDAAAQAQSIFSLLRVADGMGADAIYVHAPEKRGIGLAVYNRLIRAAAFRVTVL